MVTRRPYEHSPEGEEGEQQPWTIHLPFGKQQPEQESHLTWVEGEASPDDPMFTAATLLA
jgi:hypothetical protein